MRPAARMRRGKRGMRANIPPLLGTGDWGLGARDEGLRIRLLAQEPRRGSFRRNLA